MKSRKLEFDSILDFFEYILWNNEMFVKGFGFCEKILYKCKD